MKQANVAALRGELLDELDPLDEFAAALNRHPKTVKRWNPPIVYIGRKPYVPRKRGREWILNGCKPIEPPRRGRGRRSAV
jgi:hypothetical protein